MTIEIVCVGKLQEKYLKEAEKEYVKRLSRYGKTMITEVKEEHISKNPTQATIDIAVLEESERLRSSAKGSYKIALTSEGKKMSSEAFAAHIQNVLTYQDSTIVFFIGGSHGLSETLKTQMDLILSFSEMTFPHQLMRVILLEQVYRAMKINHHEPYHK